MAGSQSITCLWAPFNARERCAHIMLNPIMPETESGLKSIRILGSTLWS